MDETARRLERERRRKERQEELRKEMEEMDRENEAQTLAELMQGEHNPEAARDEANNQMYRYAILFQLLGNYLHAKHGYPSPLQFEGEMQTLKERVPVFKIRKNE